MYHHICTIAGRKRKEIFYISFNKWLLVCFDSLKWEFFSKMTIMRHSSGTDFKHPIAHLSELWGVCSEYFGANWPWWPFQYEDDISIWRWQFNIKMLSHRYRDSTTKITWSHKQLILIKQICLYIKRGPYSNPSSCFCAINTANSLGHFSCIRPLCLSFSTPPHYVSGVNI